jgi:hypothetical protein
LSARYIFLKICQKGHIVKSTKRPAACRRCSASRCTRRSTRRGPTGRSRSPARRRRSPQQLGRGLGRRGLRLAALRLRDRRSRRGLVDAGEGRVGGFGGVWAVGREGASNPLDPPLPKGERGGLLLRRGVDSRQRKP